MTSFQKIPPFGIFFAVMWAVPLLASGQTLVDLKSGQSQEVQDLLAQGRGLIYVEKDCVPCRQYLQGLKACPKALREALTVVSLSPAGATRDMGRGVPSDLTWVLVKGTRRPSFLKATPTTQAGSMQKIGPLTCAQLQEMIISK